MNLDIGSLTSAMLGAVKTSLGADYPKTKDFAEAQLKTLAEGLADIGKQLASGSISLDEAQSLLRTHANTAQIVFLAVEGMGELAVENAINAALSAVKTAVNAALGVALI